LFLIGAANDVAQSGPRNDSSSVIEICRLLPRPPGSKQREASVLGIFEVFAAKPANRAGHGGGLDLE
jgi:hypothetical protein